MGFPLTSHAGVVLFDGVCNLCNAFVNFVLDRDPRGYFRFGALQSAVGQDLMQRHHVPDEELRSLVLFEDGNVYTESTAALPPGSKGSEGRLL